jgi:hypothetical protein
MTKFANRLRLCEGAGRANTEVSPLPLVGRDDKVVGLGVLAGAFEEDVYDAAGAGLPAGLGVGVEDADDGADEVVGVGGGAEVAAGDGGVDEGVEGAVDRGAGAGDEARGAAGDGVECGQDEELGGYVVDEEEGPGAEGLKGRLGGGEALGGGGEFVDLGAEDGFDEVVAGGEVAVEGSGADLGAAGDVVECGVGAVLGEGVAGGVEDALAVALGVDAGSALGRRRWDRLRGRLRHWDNFRRFHATGGSLR